MKLLVVSTWLPYPLDNGSRLRAYHLVRHLARRHSVTLLCFGGAASADARDALRSMCERLEIVPPAPLRGGRLRVRGLLSPVPRYFAQTESARMNALVAAHISRHDAAVAMEVNAAVYLADLASIPRVFDDVEVGAYRDACRPPAPAPHRWRGHLTWWKFRRFVRGLVNAFDRSTVVSAIERDHLLAAGCDGDRIAIVPNGTEACDALPDRCCVTNRLIYPGSVTYAPNLEAVRGFARDVLPLVRRVRPDVTFVVTGATDGVDVGALAASGVTFTGRLREVEPVVAGSAACVVPLRTGGGTRVKVLQAMALGTPVVSTSKGVEGLEVEAGRHVLVADDPQAFAAHVLRVLDHAPVATTLRASAHRLVRERYGWEAAGRMLDRIIDGAISHHTFGVPRVTRSS